LKSSTSKWRRGLVAAVLAMAPGMLAPGMLAGAALAAEEVRLTIRDHRFEPAEIEVPAGVKIKLMIENQDQEPEEFESYDLSREKMVPAGATVPVFIGPLEPGRYEFFGEFHQKTAQGTIVVNEPGTK
jgi:plastocyanin